jgi:hypothetical protein
MHCWIHCWVFCRPDWTGTGYKDDEIRTHLITTCHDTGALPSMISLSRPCPTFLHVLLSYLPPFCDFISITPSACPCTCQSFLRPSHSLSPAFICLISMIIGMPLSLPVTQSVPIHLSFPRSLLTSILCHYPVVSTMLLPTISFIIITVLPSICLISRST